MRNKKRKPEFYKKAKLDFPEALKKTKGFVMMACQRVGIDRSTYKRWIDTDKKFAKRCNEAMDYSCAFVESRWLQNLNEGKQGAIDRWLRYKGKEFGYTEEVTINDTTQSTQLSQEDIELLAIYDARRAKSNNKQ